MISMTDGNDSVGDAERNVELLKLHRDVLTLELPILRRIVSEYLPQAADARRFAVAVSREMIEAVRAKVAENYFADFPEGEVPTDAVQISRYINTHPAVVSAEIAVRRHGNAAERLAAVDLGNLIAAHENMLDDLDGRIATASANVVAADAKARAKAEHRKEQEAKADRKEREAATMLDKVKQEAKRRMKSLLPK
jgi:hypothetical protein